MTNSTSSAAGATTNRWKLGYDREAVSALIADGEMDVTAAIVSANERTSDGLGVIREIVESVSQCSAWKWGDRDADPSVAVSADFTCDEEGFIVNDSYLTLSVLLPTGVCLADTGLRRLGDLPWTRFDDAHDVLDGVTELLTDLAERAMRAFAPAAVVASGIECSFHDGDERSPLACVCAAATISAGE